MTSFIHRNVCFILLGLAVFASDVALASSAKLTNISITTTSDELCLFFQIDGAFKENIQKAILSGVPATFSFFITVQHARKLIPGRKIINLEIDATIKYNNLKKEFTVTRSWESDKPIVTDSFQEAMKQMSQIENLRIVNLKNLKKGKTYKIKVKAELRKITLPLYLHNIFFFVSLWDFETDWYKVKLTY